MKNCVWNIARVGAGLVVAVTSEAGCAEATDMKAVVDGNTSFALRLYGRLRSTEGNLVLSPYSISSALAMTYAGARGETARQMEQTLDFNQADGSLHAWFGRLGAALKPIFDSLKSWHFDVQRLTKTPNGLGTTFLVPWSWIQAFSRNVGGRATPAAINALCACPST
jgi:hypothetical protein